MPIIKANAPVISLSLISVLFLSAFFSFRLVTGTSVIPGDKFTYFDRTTRTYRDNFNNEFSLELTRTSRLLVQDVDASTIYYDLITQQQYFSFSFSLENGNWISSKQDGEKTSITRGLQENLTEDYYRQFVFLDGMEFPFYDPRVVGVEYKDWNGSKANQRFSYFDLVNDDALDEFEFRIELPFFVSDSSVVMEAIENQWRALAFNEVKRLPSLRWKVLEEGWEYPFRFKLLQNVAYSAHIIERTVNGDPKTIEFTPSWIGHYWLPNDSPRWNGTSWEDRDKWIAGVVNPLDSGTGDLRSDIQYYSSTPLNMKRPMMNEYFSDLTASFEDSALKIQFKVFIEDLNRLTYHEDLEWARQNRNNGTLTVDSQVELDQGKNILSHQVELMEHDFDVLGEFTISSELKLEADIEPINFLTAVLVGISTLGIFSAMVFIIRKRRHC